MSDVWATTGHVPGLKIRVPSAELRDHLKTRAEYHRQRAKDKGDQLPKLRAAAEAIKAQQPAMTVSHFNKSANISYGFDGETAVENLERDIETHRNKAVAFDWLAEHLFPQDYCLDRNELVQLEILKQ